MKNLFNAYQNQKSLIDYEKDLVNKSYYEAYRPLYFFCLGLAVVAQLLSIVSSYSYVFGLIAIKIQDTFYLSVVTLIVLIVIELAKYYFSDVTFRGFWSIDNQSKPYGFLAVTIVISFFSMYASIVGGGNFGVNVTATNKIDSLYKNEIAVLRNDIKDIKSRNTWKGSTYIVGAEKELLHKKESQILGLQEKHDQAITNQAKIDKANTTVMQYAFVIIEVCFILCTLFKWYYKYRSVIENKLNGFVTQPIAPVTQRIPNVTQLVTDETQPVTSATNNVASVLFENSLRNIVPDTRKEVTGLRNCECCGKPFEAATMHHRFCGTACRVKFNRKRKK